MKGVTFLFSTFFCLQTLLFSEVENPSLKKNNNEKDILLLLALPGSGKSEIRRYLSTLPKEELREKFGIKSKIVEMDDFPYVHMMRRISDEMVKLGKNGLFFLSPACPFQNPWEWATLDELINEDYRDIISLKKHSAPSAARWLFDRIDQARSKAGMIPAIGQLSEEIVSKLADALEGDAQKLLTEKNHQIPYSLDDVTLVIEFSRGGPDSASFPLPSPYGYGFALSKLNGGILKNASILYICVSPKESRRKNEARTDPNDPGSILHHGVPQAVMYCDYGCDDMAYLMKNSPQKDTVAITKKAKTYYLPVAFFQNDRDFTSFLRNDPTQWKKGEIALLREHLDQAFSPCKKME